jgi:hypothetical protein
MKAINFEKALNDGLNRQTNPPAVLNQAIKSTMKRGEVSLKKETTRKFVKFSPVVVAACMILVIGVAGVAAAEIIKWNVKSIDVPFAAKYTVELSASEKKGWLGELAGSGNSVEVSIAGTSYDVDENMNGYFFRQNQDVIIIEGQGGKKMFGSMHGGIDWPHERHTDAGKGHWYGVNNDGERSYYGGIRYNYGLREDCFFADMDGGLKTFYEGYIVTDKEIGKNYDFNDKAVVDVFFETDNNGNIVAIYTKFFTQYVVNATYDEYGNIVGMDADSYSYDYLTSYKRVAMADVEVIGDFNKILGYWGEQYNKENPLRPYVPEEQPNLELDINSEESSVITFEDNLINTFIAEYKKVTGATDIKVNIVEKWNNLPYDMEDKIIYLLVFDITPVNEHTGAGNGEINGDWVLNKSLFVEVSNDGTLVKIIGTGL